ncbi:hypothetical protein QF047_001746 [Arthrobacter sp. W4I7]|nr:hypothetical protein [Arthrobacter sp. W4I7]MDQ0690786.1 hypothetical protein [Arthrobacter sp. W4I7]
MEADQLSAGAVPVGKRAVPSVADVLALLAAVPVAEDGAGKIDQMREFEDVKSAVAAKQARIAVAYDLEVRREQAAAVCPPMSLVPG